MKMWCRSPQLFSRQAVDELWYRGSRCSCHAKRYIPSSRQGKLTSDGSAARRKPPTGDYVTPNPDELLRELNSGSVGWLRDEEENDWGLDDVAEHARARQHQQMQRFGGSVPSASGATGKDRKVSGARRREGSGSRNETVGETHGSPLESGLASISVEEATFDIRDCRRVVPRKSAMSSGPAFSSPGLASGHGPTPVPTATDDGSKRARATVDMEASYARHNPEIVEALRLRGFAVRVRQPGGGTADDREDEEAEGEDGFNLGRHMDADSFGLSDEDDGLDLLLDSDLAVADHSDEAHGSRSGLSGPSGRDGRSGQGAPSGTRTHWYDGLAAAGFSVRSNAAGEVFLERTVRRKAPNGAADAGGAATATAAPDAASPPPPSGRKASTAAPAAAVLLQPQPLVPPLAPMSGRPAIVKALQRLVTPQQVLDFLALSYSEWAANGYRLVDMRSGQPVAAPSPAEAAHCLRALAITARRTGSGGWRCLELAAGRQAQGLAEALRVTPPRLLPEQATQQLSAAYFDAARRFWLDPSSDSSIIDDPRVDKVRTAANGPGGDMDGKAEVGKEPRTVAIPGGRDQSAADSAPVTTALAGGELAAADDDEEGLSVTATLSYDPVYDNLVAKYTAISQIQQRQDMSGAARQITEIRQANGHATPLPGARAEGKVLAAEPLSAASPAPAHGATATAKSSSPSSSSSSATAASAAAEAATRRAAKVECLVSALWAMSSLGGPPYFQTETEAAVTILVRCLASAAATAAVPPLRLAGPRPAAAAAASAASASSAALTGWGGLTGWQAGQVLWALGNSRHVTVRLADLETHILRSGGLPRMQPRDVTRVLWGFASLGYKPERLLLTIHPDWSWRERTAVTDSERKDWKADRTRKGKARVKDGKGSGGCDLHGDVRSFTPQQLAGAVWSLAVMEQVDTGPFRSAWAQLLHRAAEVPPSEPILTQIWQANLAIHLEASSAASPPFKAAASGSTAAVNTSSQQSPGRSSGVAAEDLTVAGLTAAGGSGGLDTAAARSLLLRARDVFLAATSALRRKVQSGYQRQMANTLTGLRMMHLLEDNSAGYSIDITLPQLRIALEADGPTHTSRTPGGAVLGATAMKRRHLQRMGWHVVNVTYKEWDKLTSETARRVFLQERINDALLSRIQVDEGEEE